MRIKPAAGIFIILILSSCDMLWGNKFEITNETAYELKDIQVSFADFSGKRQSLGPGQTFSFRPSPDRDGGISVSYMKNGKRIKHELGYAAPPISTTCRFKITNNGIRGDCS